jgi:hypothetical protein
MSNNMALRASESANEYA